MPGAAPSRASGLLLAFLAYYNLLHVATHGYARYRLPVLPVLFLFAAAALVAAAPGAEPPFHACAARPGGGAGRWSCVLSLAPSLRLLAHHRALGIPIPATA